MTDPATGDVQASRNVTPDRRGGGKWGGAGRRRLLGGAWETGRRLLGGGLDGAGLDLADAALDQGELGGGGLVEVVAGAHPRG